MSSLIGRKLGSYEVQDVLGQGGMASVYLGYRSDVDRKVAIKVLPPHPGLSPDSKERFQNEARTIAKLQHPHILPLFDYGVSDDDILYLVMPYVSGGSLDRLVRRERIGIRRVEKLVTELAGALDYAHRQGVIHRDIKTANILLDGEGNVLLADFGIAKLAQGDTTGLTGSGVIGTPATMSPEQAQGMELTSQSDLYSFGVVIFELLTGKPLFETDNAMQMMLRHVTDTPPRLTELAPLLPSALDPVLSRMLAKRPQDRYLTAKAFADAFSAALNNTESRPYAADNTSTLRMETTPPSTVTPISTGAAPTSYTLPDGTASQPGQTIVIQQANQTPYLLGFGGLLLVVIALVAVVVVLLGRNDSTPQTQATSVAQATADSATPIPPTPIVVVPMQPTFGRVNFSTINAEGDSIALSVTDVEPAPGGSLYVGWLLNTRTNDSVNLGRVAVDALGNGALSYTDPEGRFLPAIYNAVALSLETSDAVEAWTEVLYSARQPEALMDAYTSIFVATDGGFRGRGLLESAQFEARFATQHAGLAALSTTLGAMRTHNEHTLNIIFGTQDDFDGNGSGANPGAKLGLLPLLDQIEAALTTATEAEDANLRLQTEAELIRVCIGNVRSWVGEVIDAERTMLALDPNTASIADAQAEMDRSTAFAVLFNDGQDQNENGEVEPFEGECGLSQVSRFGLVVGSMDIVEGAVTPAGS